MTTMAGAALMTAFLVQVGPAQQAAKLTTKASANAPAAKGKAAAIPAGDWPMYSRDLTSSRYSPLKQIATANVSTMQKAWSYRPAAPPAAAPATDAPEEDGGGRAAAGARVEAEQPLLPLSLSRRRSW